MPGKAEEIHLSVEDKLRVVVQLLFHQDGPVNYKGFDPQTGHSEVALRGLLHRLKKQYVIDWKSEKVAEAHEKKGDDDAEMDKTDNKPMEPEKIRRGMTLIKSIVAKNPAKVANMDEDGDDDAELDETKAKPAAQPKKRGRPKKATKEATDHAAKPDANKGEDGDDEVDKNKTKGKPAAEPKKLGRPKKVTKEATDNADKPDSSKKVEVAASSANTKEVDEKAATEPKKRGRVGKAKQDSVEKAKANNKDEDSADDDDVKEAEGKTAIEPKKGGRPKKMVAQEDITKAGMDAVKVVKKRGRGPNKPKDVEDEPAAKKLRVEEDEPADKKIEVDEDEAADDDEGEKEAAEESAKE